MTNFGSPAGPEKSGPGGSIVTPIGPTYTRIIMIGIAGLVLAVVSTWLTLTSENMSVNPSVAASIRAMLIVGPIAVGLYIWFRRPTSRFALILVVWGFAFAPITLNASSDPLLYTAATVYTPFYFVLSAYLVLAYPHGRLETRPARIVVFSSLGVAASWITNMLFTDSPPTLDWFVRCSETCPENLAFMVDNPGLADLLATLSRAGTSLVTLAIAIVYGYRLYYASRPMRRTLFPVALVYVATTLAGAVFRAAENAEIGSDTVNRLAIVVGISRAAVPFGVLMGMITGQMFAGTALTRLLPKLDGHPGPDQLQEVLSEALGDQSLTIAYWLPERRIYVDRVGEPIEIPDAASGQTVTEVKRENIPVAAIIHDQALAEDPGMVEAAAAAALLTLENARLQAELRASIVELRSSRERIVAAADVERRRIERDLHDGAQARLVALRIELELLGDKASKDPQLAEKGLADLGEELDEALEDLRRLAHGIYPPLLEDHGLDDALQAAALRSPLPTQIEVGDIGRYRSEVESAVYFCCLEALQNVSKHAGKEAIASIRIWNRGSDLCFEIKDTGYGFEPAGTSEGMGLRNMRERLGAVGGEIDLTSAIGSGTVVSGRIPATKSHQEV